MEHDFPESGSRNHWPWRKESRKDCYCKKYLTKFACWVFCVCTKYCWKSLPKNNFIDLGFRGCGFREIDFLIIETFAFKLRSIPLAQSNTHQDKQVAAFYWNFQNLKCKTNWLVHLLAHNESNILCLFLVLVVIMGNQYFSSSFKPTKLVKVWEET